jgi:hypothetical protein
MVAPLQSAAESLAISGCLPNDLLATPVDRLSCGRSGHFAKIHSNGEILMPKFVIEREIPGAGKLSDAELKEISQKSVSVLKGMGPEIQWLHSYVTGDKVYCVYLAPDEAAVREHAKRGGFPANRISAVRRLIDPSTAE